MTDDDLPPHLRDRAIDRVPPPQVPLELPRDSEPGPNSDRPPKTEPYGTPYLRRD